MNLENQIQLKHSSISYVPLGIYEKDFTFLVNDVEIKTSRIIADLLSPKISQIHCVDPTFSVFSINTTSIGDFSHILNLINFEIYKIPENEFDFFVEVFEQLGNESIKITTAAQGIDITLDNVIDLIKKHEKHYTFYCDQISTEIDFLSKHFFELFEGHKEELKHLSFSTIERILNNENLRINDEDQILGFVNEIYKNDKNCGTFYEYVLFSNVSVSKINEFIQIFDISDLTKLTWLSISDRLQHEITNRKSSEKEKNRYSSKQEEIGGILFKKEENKDFTGIINYLKKKSNNNILNEINFTSSTSQHSSQNCIANGNPYTYFASDEEKNAWVCLEFKNHQIALTDYTIGSTNNGIYIRSWALEGSNDNSNWDKIDSQENCQHMNGNNFIHTFNIQNANNKKYRFIRLRSTGPSWYGNDYLRVNSIEFYGKLF